MRTRGPNERAVTRIMLGVVSSVIILTGDQEGTCHRCAADVRLTGFDEEYSLALVWRLEVDWNGGHAAP